MVAIVLSLTLAGCSKPDSIQQTSSSNAMEILASLGFFDGGKGFGVQLADFQQTYNGLVNSAGLGTEYTIEALAKASGSNPSVNGTVLMNMISAMVHTENDTVTHITLATTKGDGSKPPMATMQQVANLMAQAVNKGIDKEALSNAITNTSLKAMINQSKGDSSTVEAESVGNMTVYSIYVEGTGLLLGLKPKS